MDGLTTYHTHQDYCPAESQDAACFRDDSSLSGTAQSSSRHLPDHNNTVIYHRFCKLVESIKKTATSIDAKTGCDAETFKVCPESQQLKDRKESILRGGRARCASSYHNDMMELKRRTDIPLKCYTETISNVTSGIQRAENLLEKLVRIVDRPGEISPILWPDDPPESDSDD